MPTWDDRQPIYRQLADRLAGALLDGDPPEGEPMPSVRAPAAQYMLNPITVGRALQALATEVEAGRLALHRAAPLDSTLAALQALPGIGDWSAQLIAMRALAWPDAWPASDIGVLQALDTRDPREATARAEPWRPWRAYAVMRLWLPPAAPPEPTPSRS